MIDEQRLAPIGLAWSRNGPPHQQVVARQLIVLAPVGVSGALTRRGSRRREASARTNFVQAMRDAGRPAGRSWRSSPGSKAAGDQDLVEDLLRSMPDRPDAVLGDAVARSPTRSSVDALQTIVPLWGESAKKPLMEALEHADEPTRVSRSPSCGSSTPSTSMSSPSSGASSR